MAPKGTDAFQMSRENATTKKTFLHNDADGNSHCYKHSIRVAGIARRRFFYTRRKQSVHFFFFFSGKPRSPGMSKLRCRHHRCGWLGGRVSFPARRREVNKRWRRRNYYADRRFFVQASTARYHLKRKIMRLETAMRSNRRPNLKRTGQCPLTFWHNTEVPEKKNNSKANEPRRRARQNNPRQRPASRAQSTRSMGP